MEPTAAPRVTRSPADGTPSPKAAPSSVCWITACIRHRDFIRLCPECRTEVICTSPAIRHPPVITPHSRECSGGCDPVADGRKAPLDVRTGSADIDRHAVRRLFFRAGRRRERRERRDAAASALIRTGAQDVRVEVLQVQRDQGVLELPFAVERLLERGEIMTDARFIRFLQVGFPIGAAALVERAGERKSPMPPAEAGAAAARPPATAAAVTPATAPTRADRAASRSPRGSRAGFGGGTRSVRLPHATACSLPEGSSGQSFSTA